MPSAQLKIRLIPRAKSDKIDSWTQDKVLKVRVHSPPVDGKANQALIKLLSKAIGCAKSNIIIKSGHTSRNKTIEITGLGSEELKEIIS